MCGIAGCVSEQPRVPVEGIRRASEALVHRGPDESGLIDFISPNGCGVALASRRLAILDLSPAGHMPMHDPATGNWIIFNGEIFNFRAIRKELQASGVIFTSDCDTEVALKAYGLWGEECLQHFRGMFAIAIWDAKRESLFLARDRMGIKPLYFTEADGRFIFASEVRAILASGLVPRELNRIAVEQFLSFGSVSDPDTIISGVRALRAGHKVTWHRGKWEEKQYWSLPKSNREEDRATAARRVRELLHDAVELRLISDVPLSVFLSGGIDSSAIVGVVSGMGGQKLNTFSVVFEEESFDERQYSRLVAERFGTHHTEIPMTGNTLLHSIPDALRAMDQPSIDGLNTFVVSREARKAGFKVALSGLGADELFFGYGIFSQIPKMTRLSSIARALPGSPRVISALYGAVNPGQRRERLSDLLAGRTSPYETSRRLFSVEDVRKLSNGHHVRSQESVFATLRESEKEAAGLQAGSQITYLEFRNYLPNTLLRDSDAMSMAHSLELRVPFLDHHLVEYVASLSDTVKVGDGTRKSLLLQALHDILPAGILNRPKRGFTLPFEHWFRGPLKSELEGVLKSSSDEPILKRETMIATWQTFLDGRTGWARPWALYVLSQWCAQNQILTNA